MPADQTPKPPLRHRVVDALRPEADLTAHEPDERLGQSVPDLSTLISSMVRAGTRWLPSPAVDAHQGARYARGPKGRFAAMPARLDDAEIVRLIRVSGGPLDLAAIMEGLGPDRFTIPQVTYRLTRLTARGQLRKIGVERWCIPSPPVQEAAVEPGPAQRLKAARPALYRAIVAVLAQADRLQDVDLAARLQMSSPLGLRVVWMLVTDMVDIGVLLRADKGRPRQSFYWLAPVSIREGRLDDLIISALQGERPLFAIELADALGMEYEPVRRRLSWLQGAGRVVNLAGVGYRLAEDVEAESAAAAEATSTPPPAPKPVSPSPPATVTKADFTNALAGEMGRLEEEHLHLLEQIHTVEARAVVVCDGIADMDRRELAIQAALDVYRVALDEGHPGPPPDKTVSG